MTVCTYGMKEPSSKPVNEAKHPSTGPPHVTYQRNFDSNAPANVMQMQRNNTYPSQMAAIPAQPQGFLWPYSQNNQYVLLYMQHQQMPPGLQ